MRIAAAVIIVVVNLFALIFFWPSGEGEDVRPQAGRGDGKKVFILGCDGLDAELIERMLREGRLPNMAKLAAKGGFRPLTTSIPPQSPVAWSNFITGAGPGVHGIFDFIHREPDKQYAPYFSTNYFAQKHNWWITRKLIPETVGGYVLRGTTQNTLMRKGTPFWDYLDTAGIKVDLYRLPANYPPSKSKYGNVRCLPGMGVPDAVETGTQGTYQQFTTKPRREVELGGGKKFKLRRDPKTRAYVGTLRGPSNMLLADAPNMTLDFSVYRDPERDAAIITYENKGIAGTEEVSIPLNVGEWSDWVYVDFPQTGLRVPAMRTMARFLLQGVRPHVDVYVTPLNFAPDAAPPDFSEPSDFVKDIGEGIGPFYTQGFAEDFKARDQNVLSDEEFRQQAELVLDERMKMLDFALDNYVDGLLFFYFSSSDLQAHIYWWESTDEHPIRSWEDAQRFNRVVEDVYVRLDEALGHSLERLGEDLTVIVMSDHGFGNFGRGFALNTWLREEGYLVADRGLLFDCDWSQTRVYGLGLNGLYLNLKGREPEGIVDPAEADELLDELCDKLVALRDPENGRQVILRCYKTKDWYHGPEAVNAPDIIVGYGAGYRSSWNTALGDFDKSVVVPNHSAWSADHCVARELVPGIVIANRPINRADPALIDLAPTILGEFGLPTPETMTGRNIFGAPEE